MSGLQTDDHEAARRIRWIGTGLLCWLSNCLPSPDEVAIEVRALARRHPGQVLKGAARELRQSAGDPHRERLLRACVQSLVAA